MRDKCAVLIAGGVISFPVFIIQVMGGFRKD
jgi:hypothetical protein